MKHGVFASIRPEYWLAVDFSGNEPFFVDFIVNTKESL